MKITQVINNNLVFSSDESGKEIVVVGRGLGYQARRGDEVSAEKIEKIFALKDDKEKNHFLLMVQDIPYEVISFGLRICDYITECSSKHINRRYLLIPLVDHINTTLERYRDNIRLDSNILWDIRFLYKEEFKIASDVVDMMISTFGLPVDNSEANYITLHIINAELDLEPQDGYRANSIVEIAVKTVEEYMDISLDRESVDFTRFVTHLQFFAKRMINSSAWNDEDDEISKAIQYQYHTAYRCAQAVLERIEKEYHFQAHRSECFYLTIHIARLLKARK